MSLVVVTLALAFVTAWLAGGVLLPLWSMAARRWPSLARLAVPVVALPVLLGLAVALAAVVPGDPHLDQLLGCHCEASMPAWMHLCPVHPGEAAPAVPWALAALLVLLPGRFRAALDLARQSRGKPGRALEFADLGTPTARVVGWLHPRVVIDRGLWSRLTGPERQVVLEHERAHVARRDPLVLALLSALLIPAPGAVRRLVIRTWLSRAEQQADAMAAQVVSDPLLVAETLLRCARLGVPVGPAPAWMGGSLARRVNALADNTGAPTSSRPDLGRADAGLVLAGLALLLFALPWLHHQVEHLINLS